MRVKKKVNRDPLPESSASVEQLGEFWDTHSLADYWDLTRPVEDYDCKIEREHYVLSLDPSLAEKLRAAARKRGISSETLVHLWLSERLQEANGTSS